MYMGNLLKGGTKIFLVIDSLELLKRKLAENLLTLCFCELDFFYYTGAVCVCMCTNKLISYPLCQKAVFPLLICTSCVETV